MSSCVLDASALLALLQGEPGADCVADGVAQGAVISAVNLSEVVAKLSEKGMSGDSIHGVLDPLGMDVRALDTDLAYTAGVLRPLTRSAGLSLGDRACLALSQALRLPVLTTDRSWESLRLDLTVQVVR